MIVISEEEFKQKKTSDTIFVLGSGASINKLNEQHWNKISTFNSIGMNWFCNHLFEPTFYLIREQANLPFRKSKKETIKRFINLINRYSNTCCIICDVSHHTRKAYQYKKDKRITRECIFVRDDKTKKHARKLIKYMPRNPFEHGLIHGSCTMYNIMHLVKFLEYKRIIFVGVDLYNSKYFWLGDKETRRAVVAKGKSYKHKHAVAGDVLELIDRFKRFGIPMYAIHKKSLLTRHIPYISLNDVSLT